MSSLIRVGTRQSKLALAQSKLLISKLTSLNPQLVFEIVGISTKGDREQTVNFADSSRVGWFTKELEKALLEQQIDLAIHSLKDVPTTQPPGLSLASFPFRGEVDDVLLFRDAQSQARWQQFSFFVQQHLKLKVTESGNVVKKTLSPFALSPAGIFQNVTFENLTSAPFTIGTASPRRELLLKQYQGLGVQSKFIRGNIDTRIRKLQQPISSNSSDSSYDALVLAKAGLSRLGIDYPFTTVLSHDCLIPAPGQGSLGVQCRTQNSQIKELLKSIHDRDTYYAVNSERYFMQLLEAGCKTPLGAYAELQGENILLKTQHQQQDKIVFYELLTTIANYKKDIQRLLKGYLNTI